MKYLIIVKNIKTIVTVLTFCLGFILFSALPNPSNAQTQKNRMMTKNCAMTRFMFTTIVPMSVIILYLQAGWEVHLLFRMMVTGQRITMMEQVA